MIWFMLGLIFFGFAPLLVGFAAGFALAQMRHAVL